MDLRALNISSFNGPVYILSGASYLEDVSGKITIDSLLQNKSIRMTKNNSNFLNFGLSASYYWFKIDFVNDSLALKRFIKIESQEIYNIDIYLTENNNVIQHLAGGKNIPAEKRDYYSVNHIFHIDFPAHSNTKMYVRMFSPLVLWMTLHTTRSVSEEEYKELIPVTILFGVFIAILIYNLFLAISLWDKIYLFYLAHGLCLSIFFFITNGFVPLLLPSLIPVVIPLTLIAIETSIVFYLLFTSALLETRTSMPKVNKLLFYLIPLFALSAFSWVVFPYHISVMYIIQPLSTVFILIAIGVSVYAVVKKYKSAKFFLSGTLIYQAGSIITGLTFTGRAPLNNFTINAMQVGFACELLLLSFALADKMNSLKEEKERAEQREIQLQQKFSQGLIESQENERKRIAGALHDSIGQNLLIIKNKLLSGLKDLKDVKNGSQFSDAAEIVSNSIQEVREISQNLRPHHLDQLGLTLAVESVIDKVSDSTDIEITSKLEMIDGLIPNENEINFFRIIQESLNNIIKHSGASKASIIIRKNKNEIDLLIEDNGVGIDPIFMNGREGSLGIVGIRERAKILGGEISFHSAANGGTLIELIIPIKKGEN